MHSHHSHSGDYVSHAKDTLDDIAQRAVDLKFDTFCLTEHMPRLDNKHLYPEELELNFTKETLEAKFDKYYVHALRIQKEKFDNGCLTKFLVGLEVEGLDLSHIEYVKTLKEKYPQLDMYVGSVHHVKGIPIDFNREEWLAAKEKCGGSLHSIYKAYFEMLRTVVTELKPPVIGHIDLIRLFASDDDVDSITGLKLKHLSIEQHWPDIWEIIVSILRQVKSYGGLIEINSAAIRKGWNTPYPKEQLAKAVIRYCDGRFCLSDDSHSIDQVGLNYHKSLDYIKNLGLKQIWYLDIDFLDGKKVVTPKSVSLEDVEKSPFWEAIK